MYDYIMKAEEHAAESKRRFTMPQFLVAIHHPDYRDPSGADNESMMNDINALNVEMVEAGVRVFVGGLHAPEQAKSVRTNADRAIVIMDGPYLETKEYIGGFWVLETEDMDAAMEWAKKAAVACRASVEVRPFITIRRKTADEDK
jgi:hypothetical protein